MYVCVCTVYVKRIKQYVGIHCIQPSPHHTHQPHTRRTDHTFLHDFFFATYDFSVTKAQRQQCSSGTLNVYNIPYNLSVYHIRVHRFLRSSLSKKKKQPKEKKLRKIGTENM